MNRTCFVIVLILFSNSLFGQKDCNCVRELDQTDEIIVNAKSYKIQVKEANKEADFKKWKEKIRQEIQRDSLRDFFCSGYLQKFISFIDDRHNQIYLQQKDGALNVPDYPRTIDITQVEGDEVSGIYYAGEVRILIKKENDSLWFGITLKSNSREWKKGKIRLRIHKTSDNHFELFEFYKNGLLFYQKNIDIEDGRISSTYWNKTDNYFFNKNFESNFTYESINSSFDYIGIKTLKRTRTLMQEAEKFYKDNLKNLSKENLIIDLRNNGGGSIDQIKPLLNALKKNRSIKNVWVLINFKTASAAEIAVLQLKKDSRTIIAGENSRGMLAYGYGNKAFAASTECFDYKVVLSTKQGKPEFREYEYSGIKPDYDLDNKSDWIEQVILLKY